MSLLLPDGSRAPWGECPAGLDDACRALAGRVLDAASLPGTRNVPPVSGLPGMSNTWWGAIEGDALWRLIHDGCYFTQAEAEAVVSRFERAARAGKQEIAEKLMRELGALPPEAP